MKFTAHDQGGWQASTDIVGDRVSVACKLGSLALLEVLGIKDVKINSFSDQNKNDFYILRLRTLTHTHV